MNKNIQKINYIHISGQVYSNPEEKISKNTSNSGFWMIRKIRMIIASNQWIDFVFEDLELWTQVKELPIGYYLEVSGTLRNSFSRKYRGDKAQIDVEKIIYSAPIKTTKNSKFLMSKEIIEQRKSKK